MIALVVTIIILLILAAVTTSFVLSDNGIFNKAAGAVRRHTIADEKEQITMAFASCRMQLIQNRITVSVVDTKKYAAISSGSSNEENEVQETNNTVDTPLDDEDLVTAPMLQRALNGSKEDTDSKIALVTSDRTKYELDVEFTKTHNQYTVSARNGEVVSEEINKLLYPNKTLNITAFTDTTTVQTYEIPKSGWLYISGYRTTSSYSTYFYRNDMLILHIWGAPQATTGASSANSVYIPVKKGDIIKKTQAMNNYNFVVNLYYYE